MEGINTLVFMKAHHFIPPGRDAWLHVVFIVLMFMCVCVHMESGQTADSRWTTPSGRHGIKTNKQVRRSGRTAERIGRVDVLLWRCRVVYKERYEIC